MKSVIAMLVLTISAAAQASEFTLLRVTTTPDKAYQVLRNAKIFAPECGTILPDLRTADENFLGTEVYLVFKIPISQGNEACIGITTNRILMGDPNSKILQLEN